MRHCFTGTKHHFFLSFEIIQMVLACSLALQRSAASCPIFLFDVALQQCSWKNKIQSYFLNPYKVLWWLHTLDTPVCGGFQPQMFACRLRRTVGVDSWEYNVCESTESQHFYYNGHNFFLTIKLWVWLSKLNQTFTTEVVEQETLMPNFWNSHLGHFGRRWQLVYTMTTLTFYLCFTV